MIRSMFAAVGGLRVHQNRLDVVSNNIANVNTHGFKPGQTTFKEAIYQNTYNSTSGNNVYGGQNPSQVGYGAQLAGITLDFRPGNYEPTGRGMDVMIGGSGFFLVGPKNLGADDGSGIVNLAPGSDDIEGDGEPDTDGLSALKLTRVGRFFIDGDGYVVDENRNVVYGFYQEDGINSPATGTTKFDAQTGLLVPLRVPSLAVETGDPTSGAEANHEDTPRLILESISIDGNGVISGKSDKEQYFFGQIAVCNVPNQEALEKIGDSYYQIKSNTGICGAYIPGTGSTGGLVTNGLEMSMTDLAQEITSMIIAERGLQANSKMITVSDEVLQELVNMKR